jgi:hypothetical protein
MNWWVYIGWACVFLIGALLFIAVTIGAFICIDNWEEDKSKKNKVSCCGCIYLACDGVSDTCCLLGVNEHTLKSFNKANIRPCYCKEDKHDKS